MIPYGRQDISQADIDTVVEVLRSDFLTQGPMVARFEAAVAEYCDAQHAVAVNSATSALHIACVALGLGRGDWLWTSPNTFVASANSAMYCGAKVDFVDIDPRTYNLCPQKLEQKLEQANKNGTLPKIVMPVHFAGQPCDMPAIHALSRKYGFRIIEDASHAIGASYGDVFAAELFPGIDSGRDARQPAKTKVGSCTHSDITVFSFHPVKIITTGEGGMAMSKDEALADHMRRLRAHGITNDITLMHARSENEIWNYQQIELGFNYRMTDIQAAIGLSQLTRLPEYVTRRHEIACYYDDAFSGSPVITPWQDPEVYSSYHLYPVRVRKSLCGKTQEQVYHTLRNSGIAVNLHYIPVYRQPYYEAMGFGVGLCPEAERFHREAISFPMFPTLKDEQQGEVISALKKSLA